MRRSARVRGGGLVLIWICLTTERRVEEGENILSNNREDLNFFLLLILLHDHDLGNLPWNGLTMQTDWG
jgi:hypothetical protein